jgi:hypothetical protein
MPRARGCLAAVLTTSDANICAERRRLATGSEVQNAMAYRLILSVSVSATLLCAAGMARGQPATANLVVDLNTQSVGLVAYRASCLLRRRQLRIHQRGRAPPLRWNLGHDATCARVCGDGEWGACRSKRSDLLCRRGPVQLRRYGALVLRSHDPSRGARRRPGPRPATRLVPEPVDAARWSALFRGVFHSWLPHGPVALADRRHERHWLGGNRVTQVNGIATYRSFRP